MKRKLSKIGQRYYDLAKKLKLSCPLGRAVHCASRHMNDGWSIEWYFSPERCKEVGQKNGPAAARRTMEHRLRRIKLSTAKRWLAHWNNDGSVKALKYSRTEWNDRRKTRAAELQEQRTRSSLQMQGKLN